MVEVPVTSDTPDVSKRPKRLLGWLLVLLIALFALAPTDPELRRRFAGMFGSMSRSEPGNSEGRLDKPLGYVLSNDVRKEIYGNSHPRIKGPYLVVALSNCDDCTSKRLEPSDLAQTRNVRVVIMLPQEGDIHEVIARFGEHTDIVRDRGNQCLRELNAYFQPRGYLLDVNHRLVAQQRQSEPISGFLRRCHLTGGQ